MTQPEERDAELDLDAPWCIGERAFAALVDDLRSLAPKTLVEFGAGRSSIRLAQALPDTRILSIESDRDFHERGLALRERYAGLDNLTLEHRPLVWQRHGLNVYQSFAPGPFPFESVDAVLIDGPPERTRRGREACLHQILPKVPLGGRLYLDDFVRPGEQRTLRNWQRSYPGALDARVLEVGHRICVVTKVGATDRPRGDLGVAIDTGANALYRFAEVAYWRVRSKLGLGSHP